MDFSFLHSKDQNIFSFSAHNFALIYKLRHKIGISQIFKKIIQGICARIFAIVRDWRFNASYQV